MKRGRKRGGITPAGRKRLAEAMKRRWAEGKFKGRSSRGKSSPKAGRAIAVQAKAGPKRRGGLTPAGRKRLSEMMKKRWAERRKKTSA